MKKLALLSLAMLALLTFGLMAGCNNSNNPSGPAQTQVASIEVRSNVTQISGFKGETKTAQIIAIPRDAQGNGMPGIPVDFAIQNPVSYKGTIVRLAADTASDANGEVHATYTVVIDRSTPVIIQARNGNIIGTFTLTVTNLTGGIGAISLTPNFSALPVPPNQSRSFQFTATLTDTGGRAIPGMTLNFRTNPASMGNVDSDTGTTDLSGAVNRTFTSIVNQYGSCQIVAQVGDSVATATVQIIQTAAPTNIDVIVDPTSVEVAAGASANITVSAIVTDNNRVGVPKTAVAFQVHPFTEGGVSFGAITAHDTTDSAGTVRTTFQSLGNTGKLWIYAHVILPDQQDVAGGIADSAIIEVKRLSTAIQSLTVTATPKVLDLPPDSLGQAKIYAQVRDISNKAIPNVQVDFTTDIGTVANPTVTDSTGIATCDFITNFEVGVATITASIPGTQYQATCTVQIKQNQQITGMLRLSSDVSFIYADNGITVAHLKARLTDQDNVALVGKNIAFSCPFGAVNATAVTDTIGIAQAVFTDLGMPSLDDQGNPVPVWIKATYKTLDLIDSVGVTIRPRNPVDHITLSANKQQLLAGSPDSVALGATCFLLSGDYAPQGVTVTFSMDPQNGRFTNDVVPVGTYGHAETFYLPGQFTGPVTIHAQVFNEGGGPDSVVTSNDVIITILPGPPSGIRLTANPSQLRTNDAAGFSTIQAFVTDTAGNPVIQGTLVRFTTTKGEVLPTALTDSTGKAVSRLTAGVESGIAEVTGTVTTPTGTISGLCTVTFIAGYPNVIELSADPLTIAVRGTGDISTSTIKATVKDANGNLIETATTVVFQLLNNPDAPLGCDLNNHNDIDSARTANGVAVASLNSGTQIGGVLVRAYTWRDPDTTNPASWGPDGHPRTDTVSVILSNVAVVSGPPYAIDIDVNDQGADAGGGTWKIPVSARVYDLHLNPVADRIPVVFSVDPDNIATIDPGYTGNDVGSGATRGLAFSKLYYNSQFTFSPVTITAIVQAPSGIINGQRPHVLPLQLGNLVVNVDPQNFLFNTPPAMARMTVADTCTVRIWAILTDGHQILINNGPILFRADRANFWWKNMRFNGRWQMCSPDPHNPIPVRRLTGKVDQENNEDRGVATVYLRGWMNEFYLDDFTLEQTVHIEANVEGYDVAADPAFFFCTRR